MTSHNPPTLSVITTSLLPVSSPPIVFYPAQPAGPPPNSSSSHGQLRAVVLTKDHLAMYPEERTRIEKAGGHVTADGRLNGRMQVCVVCWGLGQGRAGQVRERQGRAGQVGSCLYRAVCVCYGSERYCMTRNFHCTAKWALCATLMVACSSCCAALCIINFHATVIVVACLACPSLPPHNRCRVPLATRSSRAAAVQLCRPSLPSVWARGRPFCCVGVTASSV